MKKLLTLVFALTCVSGLAGCADQPDNTAAPVASEEVSAAEIPSEETANPETWDLIPMVMINETLYLDTGYNSTLTGRCGVMDGEITSEVAGSEQPTENGQSNFGTGYPYQYGAAEGTVEVYMDGNWRIFATEEVRQEMQFPATEAAGNP